MSRITLRVAALAATTLTLAACGGNDPPRFKARLADNQAALGATTIAVTAVEPWSDVADDLMPDFTLTGDDAKSEVLPITQQALLRTLDYLGIAASVGLPNTTNTRTAGFQKTDGQERMNENKTVEEKTTPGQAEDIDLPAFSRTVDALKDVLTANTELEKDPQLVYQTATALHQEVSILNRYLKSPALTRCFRPYLVRVQIGITPYARRQPYDVYTRLSFFNAIEPEKSSSIIDAMVTEANDSEDACKKKWNHLPLLVPLLVTDNLELSRESQAREVVRQFAASVSGTVQNVGLGGELQQLNQKLEATLGNSLNSLTSVTRLADNTIQARFGAANDPSVPDYGRAMVPRNYNVSLVMLVPEAISERNDAYLQIIAKTDLRDVNSGQLVDAGRREEALHRLRRLQELYRLSGWDGNDDRDLYEKGEQLAFAMARHENGDFCRIAAQLFGDGFNPEFNTHRNCLVDDRPNDEADPTFLNRSTLLWSELAGITSSFDVHSHWVQLPQSPGLVVPPLQSVVLLANGDDKAELWLQGGSGYTQENLAAWLRVTTDQALDGAEPHHRTYDIPPTSVSFPRKNLIRLEFPSLSRLDLKPQQVKKSELYLGLVKDSRYLREDRPIHTCANDLVYSAKGTMQQYTFWSMDKGMKRIDAEQSVPNFRCDAQMYPALWRIARPGATPAVGATAADSADTSKG